MFEFNIKNPFIHGTDSSVLRLLPLTQFSLFSPIHMIHNYSIAPEGGEITGGGLAAPHSDSRLAFGRVHCSGYSLEKILQSHAVLGKNPEQEKLIIAIKNNLKNGPSMLFSNINILLVLINRLKQSGIGNHAFITEPELQALKEDLQVTIQFYYFILLIGSELMPSAEFSQVPPATLYQIFSNNNIVRLLKESGINIKSIYESATLDSSDLQSIADLFKTSVGDKEISLLTVSRGPLYKDDIDNPEYWAYALARSYSSYPISYILSNISRYGTRFFIDFHHSFRNILEALEHRVELLEKLLVQKPGMPRGEYELFKGKRFPIIFVVENNEKLSLVDSRTLEYRAIEPMVLGEDINIIATDTEENKSNVRNYLRHYSLETKVTVLTFEELSSSVPQMKFIHDTEYKKCNIMLKKSRSTSNDRMKILEIYHEAVKEDAPLRSVFNDTTDREKQFLIAMTEYKNSLCEELSLGNDAYAMRGINALAALNQPGAAVLQHLPQFEEVIRSYPEQSKIRIAGLNCLKMLAGVAISYAIINMLSLCSVPLDISIAIGIITACLIGVTLIARVEKQGAETSSLESTRVAGLNVLSFFQQWISKPVNNSRVDDAIQPLYA